MDIIRTLTKVFLFLSVILYSYLLFQNLFVQKNFLPNFGRKQENISEETYFMSKVIKEWKEIRKTYKITYENVLPYERIEKQIVFDNCFKYVIFTYKTCKEINNGIKIEIVDEKGNKINKDLYVLIFNSYSCYKIRNGVGYIDKRDLKLGKNSFFFSSDEVFPLFLGEYTFEINNLNVSEIILKIQDSNLLLSSLELGEMELYFLDEIKNYALEGEITFNISGEICKFYLNNGYLRFPRKLCKDFSKWVSISIEGILDEKYGKYSGWKYSFCCWEASCIRFLVCNRAKISFTLNPRIGFGKLAMNYVTPKDRVIRDFLNRLELKCSTRLECLRKIVSVVNLIFDYVEDDLLFGVGEYWQLPSETLIRGKGDCEDWANLVLSLFLAYDPSLKCYTCTGIESNEKGHAFVVCKLDKWYLFDQYVFGIAENFEDLIKNFEKDLKKVERCFNDKEYIENPIKHFK